MIFEPIKIGKINVGHNYPCFIIAEAGVNHNGNLKLAFELVNAAKAAGANAVKFQTFKAVNLVSAEAPQAKYQEKNTGRKEKQFEMLKRLELSDDDHRKLLSHCKKKGIIFLSTPFDVESADFLSLIGIPAFKIPSGEITNIPLIRHIARKDKPMVISTGMAILHEISKAVETVSKFHRKIVLLHCVSSYPADYKDINLKAMETLRKRFKVPVGYSDHSIGIEISMAAVAMGACVIEKHFTLDNRLPGPDHKMSLEPAELIKMISGIRKVESAIGSGIKRPCNKEMAISKCVRKSVFAKESISQGTIISEDMLACKRPGTGISPERLGAIIGKRAKRAILSSQMLKIGDF